MQDNLPYRNVTPFPPSPYRQGEIGAGTINTATFATSNFAEYWAILRRYRWTAVLTLGLCVSFAIFSLIKSEPVYTATAIIRIQSQTPSITGVPDAFKGESVQGEDVDYFRTQVNLLQSRNLAARVIRDLRLADDPEFRPVQTFPLWVQEQVSTVTETVKNVGCRILPKLCPTTQGQQGGNTFELGVHPDLISLYLSMISVEVVDRSQLISVAATSARPSLSKEIANAHAAAFIRTSLETRFELTSEARQFLEEKLQDLKSKVEASEGALNRFRKESRITSLEKGENLTVDRLMALNKDLTEARAKRIEAESLYRVVQQPDNRQLSLIVDNPILRQLKEQIGTLQTQRARLLTNVTKDYPTVVAIQAQITQAQDRLNQELRRIIGTIESDYKAAATKEQFLSEEMEREKQEALELQGRTVQYAILEREAQSNRKLYENVLKKTKETDLSSNVPMSNIQITDRAETPVRPNDRHGVRTVLLSLVVGLLGGVGLTLARYHLDSTLKTPEDVEQYLGLSTIGLVPDADHLPRPILGRWTSNNDHQALEAPKSVPIASGNNTALPQKGTTPLLPYFKPFSMFSECYRLIRTAILFSRAGEAPHTILVTSSLPGEGKTTTAVNVAISLAQLGAGPVLLIDADLRNGRCHSLFNMTNGPGLTHLLTGHATIPELVQKTHIPQLYLLPAGEGAPNTAELLGSEEVRVNLERLRKEFAYVVIDSGPLLPMVDSVLLSTIVDGVVLVVREAFLSRTLVSRARSRLDYVGAKILGVVLNGVNVRNPEYGEYRYLYTSSSQPQRT